MNSCLFIYFDPKKGSRRYRRTTPFAAVSFRGPFCAFGAIQVTRVRACRRIFSSLFSVLGHACGPKFVVINHSLGRCVRMRRFCVFVEILQPCRDAARLWGGLGIQLPRQLLNSIMRVININLFYTSFRLRVFWNSRCLRSSSLCSEDPR